MITTTATTAAPVGLRWSRTIVLGQSEPTVPHNCMQDALLIDREIDRLLNAAWVAANGEARQPMIGGMSLWFEVDPAVFGMDPTERWASDPSSWLTVRTDCDGRRQWMDAHDALLRILRDYEIDPVFAHRCYVLAKGIRANPEAFA